MELTIYWITRNPKTINDIRVRFGIQPYMSINRETPCIIKTEDIHLLEETARLGFIQIRKKQ